MQRRCAEDADWPQVAALLDSCALPLDGARAHLGAFTLLFDAGALVACAGLERYGDVALLRSVAVRADRRGQGLGEAIVGAALTRAAGEGIESALLLTTTGAGFFPRFGFQEIARGEVPEAVLDSVEFKHACPASATVMRLALKAPVGDGSAHASPGTRP